MAWWQMLESMLQEEFADLPDLAELVRMTIRLMLAAALGGLLGYERASKGKAAGVRTHMLVAMGSAMFVLAPQMSGASSDALSRIVQGIATGIGFIGAGTIIKAKDRQQVHGLTTAAGIWMTAAIGIAAGSGRESTAVLATLLTLLIFFLVPKVSPDDKDHERGNGHL